MAEPPESASYELVGVALSLTSLLLLAATATFAPPEARSGLSNVAGSWGRAAAGALARALGMGALFFPAFGLAWGIQCLRGGAPAAWRRRAFLLPVLATLTAIAAALLLETVGMPGLSRTGPGGYIGVAFGTTLFGMFGRTSSLVVLVAWVLTFRIVAGPGVAERVGGWVRRLKPRFAPRADDEGDWEEEDDEDAEEEDDEDVEWVEEDEDEDEGEDGELEEADEVGDTATPPVILPKRPRRPKRPKKKRPAAKRGEYPFPPTDLLVPGTATDTDAVREEVRHNAEVLGRTLGSFGVEARVVSNHRGPVITFFEIAIASGIRLSRVTALADDLAIALKAPSVRIVAPIPGRSTVGVEVPNLTRDTVMLRDLIEEHEDAADRRGIPIFLGRDAGGRGIVEDLSSMPHLLIAGSTGSGKSVCINSVLLSILYARTPNEVSLILIDPKQVELSFFEGIPHLLTPVVTDMKRAAKILEWAVGKMEERYSLLLAAGVRNISGYNAVSPERLEAARERAGLSEEEAPSHLPYLVIVVDELADLMMTNGKDVEQAITRLAQKSRAVGIHIVLATQRPSTNVITGLIKANMPTRIAFHVSSKIDSRVILDANGADKLLGMGDMLYMHPRSLHLRRAQGTLVTDPEARAVVDHLKEHCEEPEYQDLLQQKKDGLGDPMEEDDLYDDAVRVVLTTRLGSASMLQRRMGIGYTRASRLIDMMCDHAIVGPHVGSKAREVLVTLEDWEATRAGDGGVAGDEEVVDESWD